MESRVTTDDGRETGATLSRIGRRFNIGIGGIGAALVALALLPAAGLAAPHSHAPKHKFGRGTSTNWSGYAVDGTAATHVIGTWTQPAAKCAAGENSWSSPWVGIDGDNSNTVEQIGTDTDCSGGAPFYYAWYEMYPKSLVVINNIPVIAGHSYTGEVTYSGGAYIMRLTDNANPSHPFTVTQSSRKARRSSVEWVMEGPSSGLLTNFGSVPFTSAAAKISGRTTDATLGSYGSAATPITMVTQSGTPRAVPSGLTGSGGAFSVGWKHG